MFIETILDKYKQFLGEKVKNALKLFNHKKAFDNLEESLKLYLMLKQR